MSTTPTLTPAYRLGHCPRCGKVTRTTQPVAQLPCQLGCGAEVPLTLTLGLVYTAPLRQGSTS